MVFDALPNTIGMVNALELKIRSIDGAFGVGRRGQRYHVVIKTSKMNKVDLVHYFQIHVWKLKSDH